MEIITSENEITDAQRSFEDSICKLASVSREAWLGFQSGRLWRKIYWLPDLCLWAHFGKVAGSKSTGRRYWNVFGLGEPKASMSIDCEINPPLSGRNRRTGGIFMKDNSGNIHLAHRGNLNAGGSIPRQFVFSNFRGKIIMTEDGERRVNVLLVGQINHSRFPHSLKEFIEETRVLKHLFRES
ncbi:MAG: hypothetical protein WD751_10355 [Anaerolineales bacterium]